MKLLDGKKILISGVANQKSIAWGIAKCLHEAGAQLAFLCLPSNSRRVRKLVKQLDSNVVIECDVRNDDQIQNAFSEVNAIFQGELHGLVHSVAYAKIDDLGGEFLGVSREGWNLALEISAYSLVAFTRCARPLMKNAGGGSIVALTFSGGERVVSGYNIMGIAKAALNMSIRYLAYDLGPENIRVNGISSGPVVTMSSMMVAGFDKAIDVSQKHAPMLRNITADEVGKTALYFASDLSSGVTGEILHVDSGTNSLMAPSIVHPKYTGKS
jgi:enoyl-[acyl-carrier protein] reductase I